jgi:hypothetical protein
VNFVFPLEVGKSWTRKALYLAPAVISEIHTTLMMADSAVKTVDASGRLTIPYGNFDCLRIKSIRYINTKAQLFTSWIPMSNDTLILYEWFAKDVGLLLQVSSHGGEKNQNFTDAGYVARLSYTNLPVTSVCGPECTSNTALPSKFTLNQNYPNPFNPNTSISFALSVPSRIECKVFTILGREVAVLASGTRQAGVYTVNWNGRDIHGKSMPSGIYFYRLNAIPVGQGQSFAQTRKMILSE